MLTAKNVRGTIYADNGEILAQTVMEIMENIITVVNTELPP